jgi:copper chaperone CopZ
MNEKKVKIPNMTCNHCVMHIKDAAHQVDGVEVKDIDLITKEVTFTLERPDEWVLISRNLKEMGYPAEEI